MNARLNVRCCCTPNKILGTLPYSGNSEQVAVYNERVGSVNDPITDGNKPVPFHQVVLRLEVHSIYDPEIGGVEKAYKAEGMTVEQLRHVPGFMEDTRICTSCKEVRDDAGNFYHGRLCVCGSFRGGRHEP